MLARYVSAQHQIADLGVKAITKSGTWFRLTSKTGIKPLAGCQPAGKADIITNKAKQQIDPTRSSNAKPVHGINVAEVACFV